MLSRGLCSNCYQQAQKAGRLDEVAPNPSTTCRHCRKPIPPGRRWGAIFCSTGCKQAFTDAQHHEEFLRKRAEQRCVHCGEPVPVDAGTRAITCSRKCSVARQNAKRRIVKQEALRAMDRRCATCDAPIPVPDTGRNRAKYCSDECKKQEMDRRWRERSPGYMRQYMYGVTPEQYSAMLARQDHRCAICGSDTWPGARRAGSPHVDHDHANGKVRGLLCGNCNNGLGMFADDPVRLRAAADYLERAAVIAAG